MEYGAQRKNDRKTSEKMLSANNIDAAFEKIHEYVTKDVYKELGLFTSFFPISEAFTVVFEVLLLMADHQLNEMWIGLEISGHHFGCCGRLAQPLKRMFKALHKFRNMFPN